LPITLLNKFEYFFKITLNGAFFWGKAINGLQISVEIAAVALKFKKAEERLG
jgi:hypothetical protein